MSIAAAAQQKVLELIGARKRAYGLALGTPAGRAVLLDLALFCRAAETCAVAPKGQPLDRERTLIAIGRHEVWLRIQNHMHLRPEQLYAILDGRPITGDDDDD